MNTDVVNTINKKILAKSQTYFSSGIAKSKIRVFTTRLKTETNKNFKISFSESIGGQHVNTMDS